MTSHAGRLRPPPGVGRLLAAYACEAAFYVTGLVLFVLWWS